MTRACRGRWFSKEHGFDSVYAPDVLGDGAPDEAVVALAEREQRIIVTADQKDFSSLAPSSLHPATVLLDQGGTWRETAGRALIGMARAAADIDAGEYLRRCIVRIRRTGHVKVYRPPAG